MKNYTATISNMVHSTLGFSIIKKSIIFTLCLLVKYTHGQVGLSCGTEWASPQSAAFSNPSPENFVKWGFSWNKRIITYSFVNGTDDMLGDSEFPPVRDAFAIWQASTNLLFVESCDALNADILIKWVPINNFPCDQTKVGCTIYGGGGIYFNDIINWSIPSILSCSVHEIGHALGLSHTDTLPSVMTPSGGYYTQLYPDDIAGIQSLYGLPKPDFWEFTGPTNFCPNASYSVNLPTGCTILWSVTGPALISGASNLATVTVNATGSGIAVLKGLISYGCQTIPISKTINSSYTPTLSGPDKYCTTASYQVSGLLGSAIVTWTTNGAVQIVGSNTANPVTVGKLYDGTGTLSANITSNCGNKTISKPIISGTQKPSDIIGMSPATPVSPGELLELFAAEDGLLSYNWTVQGGTIMGSNTGSEVLIRVNKCSNNLYNSWLNVQLKYTNSCGTGAPYGEFTIIDCKAIAPESFLIYPNPSSDMLNISLKNIRSRDISGKNFQQGAYKVAIYNENGLLKREAASQKDEDLNINTSDLNDGTYFIHIQQGKNLIRKQIIIKH